MNGPSLPVTAAFVAIVATLLAMLGIAVSSAALAAGASPRIARGRAAAATVLAIAWLGATSALALSGALSDYDAMPPRLALVVVPAFAACFVVAFGPAGKGLATRIPVAVLVGYQAFRVPVEILLHRLFSEGVIPVQMTWEGRNLDLLTGLSALPVAWLAAKGRLPRWGLALWNVAGLALLVNIVTVALLSTPYPFRRFLEEPANEVVFGWPFVWLPGFVVPAALLGHLLVFRRLLAGDQPAGAESPAVP